MFQRSFGLIANQCAADAACNAAYPGDMRAKLAAIIARLNESPLQVEIDDQILSLDGSTLIDGLSELLKHTNYLPSIPGVIEALYNEEYSVVIPYAQALSLPLNTDNPIGAFWSIRCTDTFFVEEPNSLQHYVFTKFQTVPTLMPN